MFLGYYTTLYLFSYLDKQLHRLSIDKSTTNFLLPYLIVTRIVSVVQFSQVYALFYGLMMSSVFLIETVCYPRFLHINNM